MKYEYTRSDFFRCREEDEGRRGPLFSSLQTVFHLRGLRLEHDRGHRSLT